MQVEHRTMVAASPERIYRIYEDVANWPAWDPDTKSASLDGPLKVGARGRLTPTRGNTVPMEVTHAAPGKAFTVESRIPLFRMVFEHELTRRGSGTEVVHRVTFSGLLAPIVGRVLSRQLDAGLPVTLGNLKRLAEGEAQRGRR